MGRLLEAHAHLPSKWHQVASHCNEKTWDGSDEDGTDDSIDDEDDEADEADDGDEAGGDKSSLTPGQEDQARLVCPYPTCRRKKLFKRKSYLLRHYQRRISFCSPLKKATC